MVAFFCSTPYQVLLAINMKLKLSKDKSADIYILNHFKDATNVVNRLNELSVFNKVNYVDCINFTHSFSKYRLIRYFQKMNKFFNSKKIAKKFYNFDDVTYSELYLTYPDLIIQLAIKELASRNSKLKIHLYEDGTGGYNPKIFDSSMYKKIFNIFTGTHKIIDHYESLMLFKPELYPIQIKIPIVQIPVINKDNLDFKLMINKVFGYENHHKIEEKIIYLEQPMNFVIGLNEKINKIMSEILIDDYIVKLHPRRDTNLYNQYNVYKDNGLPWEIISLNNEIEDKILISYYSTAGITNKIIFDKEPKVIFLYNLKELKEFYKIPYEIEQFIENLRKSYKDPSKILIAKTLREIKEFIEISQNIK